MGALTCNGLAVRSQRLRAAAARAPRAAIRKLLERSVRLRMAADSLRARFWPRTDGPLVSVVLDVAGKADHGEVLRSIRAQDYLPRECLVITDREVCALAGERLVHTSSSNAATRLNLAAGRARGPLLLFLGVDDRLLSGTIGHRVRAFLRADAADVAGAYCGVHKRDLSTNGELSFFSKQDIPLQALLVRTDVFRRLGGFDEGCLPQASEGEFLQRVLCHGYRVVNSQHVGMVCGESPGTESHVEARRVGDAAVPHVFANAAETYADKLSATRRTLVALAYTCAEGRAADDSADPESVGFLSAAERSACIEAGRRKARIHHRPALASVTQAVHSALRNGRGVDVLFCPHNAYHAREMARVAQCLRETGRTSRFVCNDTGVRDEGAERTACELGIPVALYRPQCLWQHAPRAVFVMNDWGGFCRTLVEESRQLGIPTFGLVEGVQDFLDRVPGPDGPRHPYRRVDHVLLTGDFDRRFFPESAEVVGCPRIEALRQRVPPTLPSSPRVAINSNFTYGVFTKVQRRWIEEAVEACRQLGVECVVTRHHADHGELSGIPVAAAGLYEVLESSTVLVSRFSGAILEAMALGRPVVYHNPHREPMDTFSDPMGAFETTTDVNTLAAALARALAAPIEWAQRAGRFFAHHVSILPNRQADARIAHILITELERQARGD